MDKDAFAKARAHYMFKEIVEDIHAEGKITDEEMEQLNREACNRAGLFGDYILKDENLEKRGDIYVMCAGDIEMAESVFDELKKIEKKIDETSYTVDQISWIQTLT